MKIAVLGAGKMGSAAAYFLSTFDAVNEIHIFDAHEDRLTDAAKLAGTHGAKVKTTAVDIASPELSKHLKGHDSVLIALPTRHASYLANEAALAAGVSAVDILEEYHRRPDKYETENLQLPGGLSLDEYGEDLHNRALKAGITLISGMGFAPGLSNVTTAHAMQQFEGQVSAVARVGGIPAPSCRDKYPLKYTVTWSFSHVLREYMVKVPILKGNKIVEVESLTDREQFHFAECGQDQHLECAVTPGMPSFIYTLRDRLIDFSEKTVRWPGHYAGIDVLKECGMLELFAEDVDGASVRPRDLTLAVLNKRLHKRDGDYDATVMFNSVMGQIDGKPSRVDIYMWDEHPVGNLSSMARVTALPAAATALLQAQSKLEKPGIAAPEEVFSDGPYHELLKMLQQHNVTIVEKLTSEAVMA